MQNNDKKKISQAQIEASKRYHAKTYKRFSADIKIEDYNFIDEYCKSNNISKAKLCVSAIKYCIDNNIKFDDWHIIFKAQKQHIPIFAILTIF